MSILKSLFEFLVFTVIVKMIVGHWIAMKIVEWVTKESTRNMTIWQHWVHWAYGKGHQTDSVMSCSDGGCATF